MMLSESLRRGVFESFVGGVVNRFKINVRRDVLVFEDILSEYVGACERKGKDEETEWIGRHWTNLTMGNLLPAPLKRLSVPFIANRIGMHVWRNVGLIDNMEVREDGDTITIDTRNEYVTRSIGPNRFAAGAYAGILDVLTGREAELVKAEQSKVGCSYVFRIGKNEWKRPPSRDKGRYDELNRRSAVKGYALKDVLKMNVFRMKGNRILFRERTVLPVENTLFHIIGGRSLMLDEVTRISRAFFGRTVKKGSLEDSLPFMKRLMQITGWGTLRIAYGEREGITVDVRSLPFGLLREDNWDFLVHMMLGYLRVFSPGVGISGKECRGTALTIRFDEG